MDMDVKQKEIDHHHHHDEQQPVIEEPVQFIASSQGEKLNLDLNHASIIEKTEFVEQSLVDADSDTLSLKNTADTINIEENITIDIKESIEADQHLEDGSEWVECEEEEQQGSTFFWIIVIAMIAITLVAAFFYFLEKRRQSKQSNEKKKEKSPPFQNTKKIDPLSMVGIDSFHLHAKEENLKLKIDRDRDRSPMINVTTPGGTDHLNAEFFLPSKLKVTNDLGEKVEEEEEEEEENFSKSNAIDKQEKIDNSESKDKSESEKWILEEELLQKLILENQSPERDSTNVNILEKAIELAELAITEIDNGNNNVGSDQVPAMENQAATADQDNQSIINDQNEKPKGIVRIKESDQPNLEQQEIDNDHITPAPEASNLSINGYDQEELAVSDQSKNALIPSDNEKISGDDDAVLTVDHQTKDQSNQPPADSLDQSITNNAQLVFDQINQSIDHVVINGHEKTQKGIKRIKESEETYLDNQKIDIDQSQNGTEENNRLVGDSCNQNVQLKNGSVTVDEPNHDKIDHPQIEQSDQNGHNEFDQQIPLIIDATDRNTIVMATENVDIHSKSQADSVHAAAVGDDYDHITAELQMANGKPAKKIKIDQPIIASEFEQQNFLDAVNQNGKEASGSPELEAQLVDLIPNHRHEIDTPMVIIDKVSSDGDQSSRSDDPPSLCEHTTAPEIETFEVSDVEIEQEDVEELPIAPAPEIEIDNRRDEEIVGRREEKKNGSPPVILTQVTSTPTVHRRATGANNGVRLLKVETVDQQSNRSINGSNHQNGENNIEDLDDDENAKMSSIFEVIGARNMDEALIKMETLEAVTRVMRLAGLESSNLIFGIDYTASNKYQGEISFGGDSLHKINENRSNPYQQVITIMGQTLAPFAKVGYIPAYGFGDIRTSDTSIFPLKSNGYCKSFAEVLEVYNQITPKVILSGPTNFAPLIYQAIEICKEFRCYHILVIVADGQVTNERATRRAIVDACRYPLSIIVVGVGDGPWDMMRVFDEKLPKRPWDNFHFVEFYKVTAGAKQPDLSFAVQSLLEIPDQYKQIKSLGLLNFDY